ncbi:hypothetical protein THAOC_19567 [Thalassiosira oceanica]|uniref:Uncharacterized protein n=1 Tax=Thalassiosira oceanica TaxID=159749 RepID=K0S4E1_THAOC|nr:hypothetical protein THAOC_19567 [Thalassiosira oceanica]|eukprot:EJK60135.1 hypothetical protein THAOC_19567 [Thalassiosira oceanica]
MLTESAEAARAGRVEAEPSEADRRSRLIIRGGGGEDSREADRVESRGRPSRVDRVEADRVEADEADQVDRGEDGPSRGHDLMSDDEVLGAGGLDRLDFDKSDKEQQQQTQVEETQTEETQEEATQPGDTQPNQQVRTLARQMNVERIARGFEERQRAAAEEK